LDALTYHTISESREVCCSRRATCTANDVLLSIRYLTAGHSIRENVKNESKELDAALEGLSTLRDLHSDPVVALDDDVLSGSIAVETASITENPSRSDIKDEATPSYGLHMSVI
jgi:hypothetical protein